jgi:hypothetical protein
MLRYGEGYFKHLEHLFSQTLLLSARSLKDTAKNVAVDKQERCLGLRDKNKLVHEVMRVVAGQEGGLQLRLVKSGLIHLTYKTAEPIKHVNNFEK